VKTRLERRATMVNRGRPRLRSRRPSVKAVRKRRGAAAVILAALLVAAFWLWPEAPRAEMVANAPAEAPAGAAAPVVRAPPRKRPAPPPRPVPAPSIDEAQLRAAVASRAADLRACALPPGSPPQIPVRLRLAAAGVPKTVDLSPPDPIPSTLADCLRERMLAWRFTDLQLASDVDVLVTFALR